MSQIIDALLAGCLQDNCVLTALAVLFEEALKESTAGAHLAPRPPYVGEIDFTGWPPFIQARTIPSEAYHRIVMYRDDLEREVWVTESRWMQLRQDPQALWLRAIEIVAEFQSGCGSTVVL